MSDVLEKILLKIQLKNFSANLSVRIWIACGDRCEIRFGDEVIADRPANVTSPAVAVMERPAMIHRNLNCGRKTKRQFELERVLLMSRSVDSKIFKVRN